MKKLLLSLLAVAGAWTSAGAQSEIPGYIRVDEEKTVTLDRRVTVNGNTCYASSGNDRFTLTSTQDITTNNSIIKVYKFNQTNSGALGGVAEDMSLDLTWSAEANCHLTVSRIDLTTRCYTWAEVLCDIDGYSTTNVSTEGFNTNNKNLFYSYVPAKEVAPIVINYKKDDARTGSGDAGDVYISSLKVTYNKSYYLLDLAELTTALNDATQWYNTLNDDSKGTPEGSALGAAIEEANTFISENSGPIDLENGKTPADVAKLIEKLRATAFNANLVDESDMTHFIKNNSFETNSLTGWTTTTSGGNSNDTKVHENSGDHATNFTDGNYLFNTWQSQRTNATGTSATNYDFYRGYPISQTITGLPTGTYEVSALLCSDPENTTYLTINGENSKGVQSPDKETFVTATARVKVTDGTLTIGAIGEAKSIQGQGGGWFAGNGDKFDYNTWYRADNFQLKLIKADTYRLSETIDYVKPEGERKEVVLKKEMKAGKYSAVCLPFNYTPSDWTVYTLASEEAQNNGSTLAITLEPVTGELTAGHPYFVCPASDYETITANDVTLIDKPETVNSLMPLVGIFEATPLNEGDIYISTTANEMTFKYLKAGASATLKPYRAYFQIPPGVAASSIRIATDDNFLTNILEVLSEQQNAGIYDLNGRRTNAIKAGVYVANGKKVIIK